MLIILIYSVRWTWKRPEGAKAAPLPVLPNRASARLLPLQGANHAAWPPRAMPWAESLLPLWGDIGGITSG